MNEANVGWGFIFNNHSNNNCVQKKELIQFNNEFNMMIHLFVKFYVCFNSINQGVPEKIQILIMLVTCSLVDAEQAQHCFGFNSIRLDAISMG